MRHDQIPLGHLQQHNIHLGYCPANRFHYTESHIRFNIDVDVSSVYCTEIVDDARLAHVRRWKRSGRFGCCAQRRVYCH